MQKIWPQKTLIREIENSNLFDTIVPTEEKPIPECYFDKNNEIKAIVLGADPTNFSSREPLKTVFGIGGNDKRYFSLLEQNLKCIGLNLENVYVTNTIKGYLISETAKNRAWSEIAELWIPLLKKELGAFDPNSHIPVLVTAEDIYKVLVYSQYQRKAKDYYRSSNVDFVLPEQNKLERLIAPFYRHRYYKLINPDYNAYIQKLYSLFEVKR